MRPVPSRGQGSQGHQTYDRKQETKSVGNVVRINTVREKKGKSKEHPKS